VKKEEMQQLPHKLIGALQILTQQGMALGTGVLISPNLVLTVAHNIIRPTAIKKALFFPHQHGRLG
jgi:V8-like Glu-specific endopeptidase